MCYFRYCMHAHSHTIEHLQLRTPNCQIKRTSALDCQLSPCIIIKIQHTEHWHNIIIRQPWQNDRSMFVRCRKRGSLYFKTVPFGLCIRKQLTSSAFVYPSRNVLNRMKYILKCITTLNYVELIRLHNVFRHKSITFRNTPNPLTLRHTDQWIYWLAGLLSRYVCAYTSGETHTPEEISDPNKRTSQRKNNHALVWAKCR